jgi:hypothetical protein
MQISISNTIGSLRPFYNGVDYIINTYTSRVIADGGVVESINCVRNAFIGYDLKTQYETRVLADGGVLEATDCSYRAIQDLYLMN